MGVSLYLNSGNEDEDSVFKTSYTYNVSAMWYKIYPEDEGMVFIDGMTGEKALNKLRHARIKLEDNHYEFLGMNPANGFGDYYGFLEFINELIIQCIKYPNFTWESWR